MRPVIDIHRHLEAAPRIEDLPPLIREHRLELPQEFVDLKKALLFESRPGDLASFLEPFARHLHKFFISQEAVRDFTKISIQRAREEGLRYVELRFSPFYMSGIYAGPEQLSPHDIVKAVIEGRDEAVSSAEDIQVGLILIVGRELDVEMGHKVIDMAIRHRDSICGVDLAGDETHFPPHLFVDVFARARAEGIPITIHAGEAGPAENIRCAVEQLGAVRIGHGIAAARDASVLALLRERGVVLETCPTSNWLTGAVTGSPSNHPLMALHRAGVRVTVNTDDPTLQGTWLEDDLQVARTLGATDEDLQIFQRTAIDAAFVTEEVRRMLIRDLEARWIRS